MLSGITGGSIISKFMKPMPPRLNELKSSQHGVESLRSPQTLVT